MRPKKSYGQNFLIDESISERIVDFFCKNERTGRVLEVGPGKGALTKYLLKANFGQFKAVEADLGMLEYVRSNFNICAEDLINKDFLKMSLEDLYNGEEFSVIGNFPYNISSQILFHVSDTKEIVPLVVGMFQKEVAERLVSGEGSKVYGVTSVLIGAYYDCSILFLVSPGSFFPVPKVTSAVVMMKRKKDYNLPCSAKLFRSIVKASFNQRRKMIRNSIKSFIVNESVLNHEFMKRRPEQMSLEDYYTLTNMIENQ